MLLLVPDQLRLWNSHAATTGLAAYPGLLVLDAMNIVAASKDAASMERAVTMDPSELSIENIIGTVLAGLGIAILGIWKYLSERKAPTAENGDRIIPGITIADMKPIRDYFDE